MATGIQAVLFDLDGVIVFTDKLHYQAWKRLADEEGWDFDETLNHQLRGVPRMASLQVILDHNGADLPEERKVELATRKDGYYRESLKTIDQSILYPGAVELLESLAARGVKLGLCSSSKNADTVLENLGLDRYFQAVVTGNDIKRAKPDPQIFLLGAERLGVVPESCVVFEDAESGIAAALAGGMKAVGVGDRESVPNAEIVVKDYSLIDIDALLADGSVGAAAT